MPKISMLAATLVLAALLLPGAAGAADVSEVRLAGTPGLFAVRGDVELGRPTRYVTFRTAEGINARRLVVTVSGSSGRTFNARDDRTARGAPRSRTCFRSSMALFQRTPPPRRLRPGVAYVVRFYVRDGSTGPRTLFATRTLRARSYRPERNPFGGTIAPSPCSG